jgi:hypothetical protein
MPLYVEGSKSCLKALTITTGASRVQATNRRQSTWRNHPSSWFQLAKMRLNNPHFVRIGSARQASGAPKFTFGSLRAGRIFLPRSPTTSTKMALGTESGLQAKAGTRGASTAGTSIGVLRGARDRSITVGDVSVPFAYRHRTPHERAGALDHVARPPSFRRARIRRRCR